MQRFTELKVWQRSHALVLELYRLTATFPAGERFGIVSSSPGKPATLAALSPIR